MVLSDVDKQTEIMQKIGPDNGFSNVGHFERPNKFSVETEVQLDGLGSIRGDFGTIRGCQHNIRDVARTSDGRHYRNLGAEID